METATEVTGTHSRAVWGGPPSSSLPPLVSSLSVTTQHTLPWLHIHNHRDRPLVRERSLFHFPCSHFLLLYITTQMLPQRQLHVIILNHGSEILQLLLWISRRKYVIKKLSIWYLLFFKSCIYIYIYWGCF